MSTIKTLKDPVGLVGIMVSIILITNMTTSLFPTIISNLVALSTLGNFTFSSLFTAGGFAPLIVSVVVLLTVLAILGIRSKSTR